MTEHEMLKHMNITGHQTFTACTAIPCLAFHVKLNPLRRTRSELNVMFDVTDLIFPEDLG